MKRYIGTDKNSIPRVWGEGKTADIAETRCRLEVIEYIRRRPETGPVTSWKVAPASEVEA